MNVDDLFNEQDVHQAVEDFVEDLKDFEKINGVIIIWDKDGVINNRLYGSVTELVGIIERSKYSLMSGELELGDEQK